MSTHPEKRVLKQKTAKRRHVHSASKGLTVYTTPSCAEVYQLDFKSRLRDKI